MYHTIIISLGLSMHSYYALMMITGVIETFAICHLYRLLWL